MEKKTLLKINIDDIAPNPHNPRLLFDPEDLDSLKYSISKVGILVPITVYKNSKSFPKKSYILLDGERRWRCAKELELTEIPANVIDEPEDVTQNILFMFNIHHFRTEWELFPTALKLEVLIKKLDTDNEKILSEFTGVNRSIIRKCKMLLWYPKKYRELFIEKGVKASVSFFIELYPIALRLSSEDEYSFPEKLSNFVDLVLEKFNKKESVIDVKEFREIRKSMAYFDSQGDINSFKLLINRFITEKDSEVDIFQISEIEENTNRKYILKYMSSLNQYLVDVNPDMLSDYAFRDQLKLLLKNLNIILEKID